MGEVAFSTDEAGERPTVTPVSASEVWVGAHLGGGAERDAAAELIESLTWLDFCRSSARLAGEIQATAMREGAPTGLADSMIAAMAMESGEALLTRDSDFERIDGLELLSY
jgi:predicted nucleic acid-binding protein